MERFDAVIIGAGVVGLAIARELSQRFKHVLLIEKNTSFGEETSSRNSEVIHAGIYYPEDSLKAKLCVEGKHLLYEHCDRFCVPVKRVGKLLVATGKNEEAVLAKVWQQARKNNVDDLAWQTANQAKQLEPNIRATKALLSPSTGIIDTHQFMQSLLFDFEKNDGIYVACTNLLAIERVNENYQLALRSVNEITHVLAPVIINSAGLHATDVASNIVNFPINKIPEIHWCRGHYFSYSGKSPFSRLVYPVPQHHGLGIHASLDIAGQLKFGPDTEYVSALSYTIAPNLQEKFYHAIKEYFPAVIRSKLQPSYAGIRPKLQSEHQGFKDFYVQTSAIHGFPGVVNLFGIDSPGLTSSLALAKYVAKAL
ncbi:NAD(P)/FAD-dependent oxidoreductase [Thalassotalea sp. PP2-459]|uniref:NAD(P)/FAD-dependent oxidoreductase n=1 Tax=Thalassotalea sp. PP2-459 TaxID=1742724 RepID=UPI000944BB53|nr:NAD(P)/FAD-dependent oxidoreductase [Thalassotalea sp. PP2-459]OKY27575.1 FAD-dependent oxidoreductase [Thalassotalea sp. PP2-459]